MALLQIAEPDTPPVPHRHRLAVGIDLGTTNSLVATVRHGIPVVLPDAEGRPLLPSIVRYGDHGVEVGYPAQDALVADPQNTIVSVKRLMGRGLSDLSDARRFPYRYIDAVGMVQIETRSGIRTPVEISADILRALRRRVQGTPNARGEAPRPRSSGGVDGVPGTRRGRAERGADRRGTATR